MISNFEFPLRPPGHITDVIHKLESWREKRKAKKLETNTMTYAINYLYEYRELTNLVARENKNARTRKD